jgi:hypothetical protein
LNCEAGVSPQTAKPQHELVLIEQECQGQSEDSFVQKRGPRRLALATHAAEGWQPILMSTATVSFDAIFNVPDGEAAPGIHGSGVRDIKMEAPRVGARRASRGEEGVHLMLANSPWRQIRVRAEKIPGDQKHDYELRGYSHTLNALRSSIQNTNTLRASGG